MAEVHRIPDMDQVERQASEWIARLNADDVSADDRARFEVWRSAHPLHARAYDELAATWCAFTAAGPLIRAVSFGQSMNEAALRRAPRRRALFGAAAAAAVVVVTALSWYVARRAPETMFQTAIGEHAAISLPDGSALELNSNSLARVDYSEHARVIRLGGTHLPPDVRPWMGDSVGHWEGDTLVVETTNLNPGQRCTAFNVYVRSDGVRVTVSEGTVRVGPAESSGNGDPSDEALAHAPVSVLSKGQQVDMQGSAAAIRTLPPAELTRSVAWRSGVLYFENQPLSDVIDELGRYTVLQLVVNDERIRHLPVGGTFQANPQGADALLTMLTDGFGLRIRRESGRVYIENAVSAHSE